LNYRARSPARRPSLRGLPSFAPAPCARREMYERLPSLSAYSARSSSNDDTCELRAIPACPRHSNTRRSPKETSSSSRAGSRAPRGRNDSQTSQRCSMPCRVPELLSSGQICWLGGGGGGRWRSERPRPRCWPTEPGRRRVQNCSQAWATVHSAGMRGPRHREVAMTRDHVLMPPEPLARQ